MKTKKQTKQCTGCGIEVQDKNPTELGYIKDFEQEVCLRCYEIKHHNNIISYEIDNKKFAKILGNIDFQKEDIIFYVLDFYDINSTRNEYVEKLIKDYYLVIVINKFDIINKNVSLNRVSKHIKNIFKNSELKILDCLFISGTKNYGLDYVYNWIEKGLNNFYFIGSSNVGKSTLLNKLIKHYSNDNSDSEIVISPYESTTLNLIKINLNNNIIYDTPGIINENNIFHFAKNVKQIDLLKYFEFKKNLKPINYSLSSNQAIFYEKLVIFKFLSGKTNNFTFYVNRNIKLHRTNIRNIDNYLNNSNLTLKSNEKFVSHNINLISGANVMIELSGLGWISVQANSNLKIQLMLPEGYKYSVAERWI
ncbi:GTPase [Spiroplasma endosymbiont of Amphibalanus improvisus]|uniref:GTPase n=1 Tax=Spiroplasma endosymbiont of Amphibalanus improvisus TaxID=3066327 RepID=UPI00313C1E86